MVQVVETFDPVTITNIGVQFIEEDGTKSPAVKFGAAGTVGGETVLRQIIKRMEGIEADKITKPEKMTLTIAAHIKVSVMRQNFGFNNQDLKPGIYSYGTNSKGKHFTLTADVIDEFEDLTKIIAFPKCVTATGFTFNIENGADEVALMEISLEAYPDEFKQIMYDSLIAELEDPTIATTWHTQFDRTLVEAVPTP